MSDQVRGTSAGAAGGQIERTFRSLLNKAKIAKLDRLDARSAKLAVQPKVSERQDDLVRFYDHFENFVEALCDGAQYGPGPSLAGRYETERAWLTQNYGTLKPYVVAYLRSLPEDADQSINLGGKAGDTFQALIGPDSLETFLATDDGLMISRITRAREALTLYGEHLRQLAAAQRHG